MLHVLMECLAILQRETNWMPEMCMNIECFSRKTMHIIIDCIACSKTNGNARARTTYIEWWKNCEFDGKPICCPKQGETNSDTIFLFLFLILVLVFRVHCGALRTHKLIYLRIMIEEKIIISKRAAMLRTNKKKKKKIRANMKNSFTQIYDVLVLCMYSYFETWIDNSVVSYVGTSYIVHVEYSKIIAINLNCRRKFNVAPCIDCAASIYIRTY